MFEVLGVFFTAEVFFCSLNGLYEGLGMGKLQFFYQTLDPDWIWTPIGTVISLKFRIRIWVK